MNAKVLLLKRNVEPFKGLWHVVGGHVERDETLDAALKREFKEETSLDIEVNEIMGGRIEETHDRIKLIIVFRVTFIGGNIKLNHENECFGWFKRFPKETVFNYTEILKNRL